uniref:DUF668 domain-containing protein n=1 Tax=Oryza meridionalis TaxID=40149 RepID=A0A0E0CYM1_9ORYZ
MPAGARSWLADLRARFGGGGGGAREEAGLGILAFEAAAAMSRLVSLHRSLSDVEVRRLRADALRAEGVARVTSTDQSLLLRLACGELVADLDRAAGTAARLGARCCAGAPFLHDFDRVYAEAKRGNGLARLDATVGFYRGAAKRFRKMERHVAATAKLYAEMDALSELEASERRMEQWMRHSGPIPAQPGPAAKRQVPEPGEKLIRELNSQRQKVRRLMESSLWSVAAHKAASPAAAIRHSAPIFRQKDTAFSASESIKPPASTVGGSGMELRYANMIVCAEMLLRQLWPTIHSDEVDAGMDLSKRDELYKMLPVTIRTAVKAKLRESWRGQPVDEAAAAASMDAVDRMLRWLGPMAHDTVRWHDERSMERAQRFSMRPRVLMVQTLHFADRRKAEDAIVEVLIGLSCVCWYDDERRRPADWDDDD